jgi:hypothetical protein
MPKHGGGGHTPPLSRPLAYRWREPGSRPCGNARSPRFPKTNSPTSGSRAPSCVTRTIGAARMPWIMGPDQQPPDGVGESPRFRSLGQWILDYRADGSCRLRSPRLNLCGQMPASLATHPPADAPNALILCEAYEGRTLTRTTSSERDLVVEVGRPISQRPVVRWAGRWRYLWHWQDRLSSLERVGDLP